MSDKKARVTFYSVGKRIYSTCKPKLTERKCSLVPHKRVMIILQDLPDGLNGVFCGDVCEYAYRPSTNYAVVVDEQIFKILFVFHLKLLLHFFKKLCPV